MSCPEVGKAAVVISRELNMEEGWTDEEIYRDVLRPVSRLSLLSEETQETPLKYPLQTYQNSQANVQEAEAILRQIAEYSTLLDQEKDDLLRKAHEEIEKEWRGKQAELQRQRETVRQLLAAIKAERSDSKPLTSRCTALLPTIAKPCLTPLPPTPNTLSALEAAISTLRLENCQLEEQLRTLRRPVPHEDTAVVDALLTRDIDLLTARVLKGVFEGEGSGSGARWQCRESLQRLQAVLSRAWREKKERETELMTAIKDQADQYSTIKQELQSAHSEIQRLIQAQEAIKAVHRVEIDKRTRLSEDLRSKAYESLEVGQAAQVASLKGTVSGLETQVTNLKLSLATAIREKTELRESLNGDFLHTFEVDIHNLLKSVEEALNYPREHAILRGIRADIVSIITRFNKQRSANEDKENSYEAGRAHRRKGLRSESQGGLLPSEELAQYLQHMYHGRTYK